MPTVPDNGRRLPKKLLRAVGARLLGRDAAAPESEAPFEVPLEFVAPGPVRKRTLYEIDGENFSTLDDFYGVLRASRMLRLNALPPRWRWICRRISSGAGTLAVGRPR